MKAPIWYLPFKISTVVGCGGYHRGLLMERAWENLGVWWLAGMDIKDTAGWVPYVNAASAGEDITNQFVGFGIKAGLPAVVLSGVLFVLAFKGLASALTFARRSGDTGRADELLLWGLGVTRGSRRQLAGCFLFRSVMGGVALARGCSLSDHTGRGALSG